jgi:hypothetical protein
VFIASPGAPRGRRATRASSDARVRHRARASRNERAGAPNPGPAVARSACASSRRLFFFARGRLDDLVSMASRDALYEGRSIARGDRSIARSVAAGG